jgi:predicted amidohydrolase
MRRELRVAGMQMVVSDDDVNANEASLAAAIDRAAAEGATFLLTPEGSLSGYRADFDRVEVADAVDRLAGRAADLGLGLLLGTCYKEIGTFGSFPFRLRSERPFAPSEQEVCYNQVRVYSPSGEYLGFHSKIQLVTSSRPAGLWETRNFVSDPLRTFEWDGVRFGILICNDFWGGQFSAIPNNLAHRLWEMGAQVVFHAVYSGFAASGFDTPGDDAARLSFWEANQSFFAAAYQTPVVTVNAADDVKPVNCRSGVWDATALDTRGGHHAMSLNPVGDGLFVYDLAV